MASMFRAMLDLGREAVPSAAANSVTRHCGFALGICQHLSLHVV